MADKIKIVVGTSNPHKIHELNEIIKGSNVEFEPVKSDNFNPDETGANFLENACIKACEAAKVSKKGKYFMADDSGLCVDYLDGAPGIYSARYSDTNEHRIEKLLDALKEDTKRNAHFTCALCLTDKEGKTIHTVQKNVEGRIAYSKKGENGFGYDPVFVVDGMGRTMAELSEEEKNSISHRGKAVKTMVEWIESNLKG